MKKKKEKEICVSCTFNFVVRVPYLLHLTSQSSLDF